MRNAPHTSPPPPAPPASAFDGQARVVDGALHGSMPPVHIGGVGRIGREVARRLQDRAGCPPISSRPVARTAPLSPTIVVKVIAALEPGAIEPAKIEIAAERAAGCRVIVFLLLPFDDADEVPDETPKQFRDIADMLVVAPEFPPISVLRCLVNAYLLVIGDQSFSSPRPTDPFDPGFFDARTLFRNARSATIGIGAAAGRGRAIRATNQAIQMAGSLDVFAASGVLAIVAVSVISQASQLHESYRELKAALPDDTPLVFAPYVDPRLDDVVRVTLVAATVASGVSTPAIAT